jgi:hypothetical protein
LSPEQGQPPGGKGWVPPAIGQPFNPSFKFCGFFPPEIVRRRTDLKQGPKLLYLSCVHWAGNKGTFWRGFDSMAFELGYSIRQVQRDMRTLEKAGLIAHVRRGRGQTNLYQFLWHRMFEGDMPNPADQPPAETPPPDSTDDDPVAEENPDLPNTAGPDLPNMATRSAVIDIQILSRILSEESLQQNNTQADYQLASAKIAEDSPASGACAGRKSERQEGRAAHEADERGRFGGQEEPLPRGGGPKHRWTALEEANLRKRLSAFMDGDDAPPKLVRWIIDDLAEKYDLSPGDVHGALEIAWNRRAQPGERNAPRSWNWCYEVLRAAFVPGYAARLPEAAAAAIQGAEPGELSRGIDAIELPDIPIGRGQIVDKYATEIHSRHPRSSRCSLTEVKALLGRIANSVCVSECEALLRRIDASHIRHCASARWQKEGGKYAMGLRNWLEPSMNRWEEDPSPGSETPPAYTPPENLATPESQAAQRERRRQESMFLRERDRAKQAPSSEAPEAAVRSGLNDRNQEAVHFANAS